MSMSPEIGKLSESLAKAQGIMENARKDKDNAFLKSQYSTLTSVWDACRDALSSNGLCVIQCPEFEGDQLVLTTILSHSSGEYVKSKLPITPKDKSSQAQGSAITYARRYALAAMVGISPHENSDDEDDGNINNPKHAPEKKSPPSPIALTPVDLEKLKDNFYITFCDLDQLKLKEFIRDRKKPTEDMQKALNDPEGFKKWFHTYIDKK